ncbi:MAG: HD domain-containing protein, partial [Muribaculaceae bacterium]
MIDYESIIEAYYKKGSDAYTLLMTHSRQVAELSMALAKGKSELHIDTTFVYEAAMLHDIGMFRTHAPSIFCYGELPYLRHGVEGAAILNSLGLPRHALVCERHTGAGLTAQEIIDQKLPLEPRDMLPISIEEKLVCYADNFYSKSKV